MIYLSRFQFPDAEKEYDVLMRERKTCYDFYYPFKILSKNQFEMITFDSITILYGGNGSGKTTALNVIAEKLELFRDTLYNRTHYFEDYTKLCDYELEHELTEEKRIITSDDVFDFVLNLRTVNEGIDRKREDLFQEYMDAKYSDFKLKSLDDYEQLQKVNMARSRSQSQFVRKNLQDNVREHSNGESAFYYFTNKIKENGLYLLDEPENSLSPEKQQELVRFLEDSVRFFGCQFIIATHSPFLLSLRDAKIYNLDTEPVKVQRWTELPNVREYYEFFKEHAAEFEK